MRNYSFSYLSAEDQTESIYTRYWGKIRTAIEILRQRNQEKDRLKLLLALVEDKVAGCVVLQKIDDETCEMKRLFVSPGFRGRGIGKALARKIISVAATSGYKRMRLDTIGSMQAALALYRALGFKEIGPYRFNPIPGAIFLELRLQP